jgi:hypothetical protein
MSSWNFNMKLPNGWEDWRLIEISKKKKRKAVPGLPLSCIFKGLR